MVDPGHPGALQKLRTTGAHIVPVPVDEDGLIVQIGRELAPKAKLAFVTSASQFPTGVTMSADRHMELLR
jgi:GntR family transcriptional regulator/MocR family aminotransferase